MNNNSNNNSNNEGVNYTTSFERKEDNYRINIHFKGAIAEAIESFKSSIISNDEFRNCLSNYGLFFNEENFTYSFKYVDNFSIIRLNIENPTEFALEAPDEIIYNQLVVIESQIIQAFKKGLLKFLKGHHCERVVPLGANSNSNNSNTSSRAGLEEFENQYYSVELSLDKTEIHVIFKNALAEIMTTRVAQFDADFANAAEGYGFTKIGDGIYSSPKYPPLSIGPVDETLVITGAEEGLVFTDEQIESIPKDIGGIVSMIGHYRDQHSYAYNSPQSTPEYNSNDPWLTNIENEEPDLAIYHKSTGAELEEPYKFLILNNYILPIEGDEITTVLSGGSANAETKQVGVEVLKLYDAHNLCVGISRSYTKEAIEKADIIIVLKYKEDILGFAAINVINSNKGFEISLLCGHKEYQNVGGVVMNAVKYIGRKLGIEAIELDAVLVDYVLKFYKKQKFLRKKGKPGRDTVKMKRRLLRKIKGANEAVSAAASENKKANGKKANKKTHKKSKTAEEEKLSYFANEE